ncbi:DUF3515 family protein [Micrococcales bacterium 31B]|nr:DUF3515 family protein [Micrococcales bacterium 31B]
MARPRNFGSAPLLRNSVWSLLAPLALTACSPTVTVPAGPQSTDPACASVVLSAPVSVMGLERVHTTTQATVAWTGPHGQVVSLRCGAPANAPSTDCITIPDASGARVDWVATTTEAGGHMFTTFGRTPRIDVLVPAGVADGQPTAPLPDLTGLVTVNTTATETCDATE